MECATTIAWGKGRGLGYVTVKDKENRKACTRTFKRSVGAKRRGGGGQRGRGGRAKRGTIMKDKGRNTAEGIQLVFSREMFEKQTADLS
jgi:hypothetical protein